MTGEADPVMSWQTFCDFDKTRRDLAKSFRGRLGHVRERLARAQRLGCGVFVSVNRFNGPRQRPNLETIRALFLDFDAAPLPDAWPLMPDLILNTSPGKHQCLWLLCPSTGVKPWLALQRALQERYGADEHCRGNVCQVMRVAGFAHMKAAPHVVRIVHAARARSVIDIETLADLFEVNLKAAVAALRERTAAGRGPIVPPACGWDSPADVAHMTEFLREPDNWNLTPNGGGIFRMACICRDYALSPERATELMEEHCPIGFDDLGHIARKVASAYAYASGEAGARSFAQAVMDFKAARIGDAADLDFTPIEPENPFDDHA